MADHTIASDRERGERYLRREAHAGNWRTVPFRLCHLAGRQRATFSKKPDRLGELVSSQAHVRKQARRKWKSLFAAENSPTNEWFSCLVKDGECLLKDKTGGPVINSGG